MKQSCFFNKFATTGLVLILLFSMVIGIVQATTVPSISFSYNFAQNRLTVISTDTGYHYSSSTTPDGANLVFVKENSTYYVLENLTIGSSGVLETKEIMVADSIFGFSAGTYSIIWRPTGSTLWSFTVSSGVTTPSLIFRQDDVQHTLTVVSADTGYQYSSSTSTSGADLIIQKNGVTYYVLSNLTLGTSGFLSIKAIQAGDTITGFSSGTYSIQWVPTGETIAVYNFIGGATTPSLMFRQDDVQHTLTIVSADAGYYYSSSNSSSRANLVFQKNGVTYYVLSNLAIGTSGFLASKEIQAGDVITGFSAGAYSIQWVPTGVVIAYFNFVGGAATPSISFSYDDTQKRITVVAADSGYRYSSSSSQIDVNLVFEKNDGTNYCVLDNLTIGTSGILSTKIIQAGDSFSGFSSSRYSVIWEPTGEILWSFVVSGGGVAPIFTFSYDDAQKKVTMMYADPGYHYSDTSYVSDHTNLYFVKDGVPYYILNSQTVGVSGVLSTKEIQVGGTITGFTPGHYEFLWKPTLTTLGSFNVLASSSTPSFNMMYSYSLQRFIIIGANSGYHYSGSSSPTGANFVFIKNNVTYYVLINMALGTSGSLSTKEIQVSDYISGFSVGTYSVKWVPTQEIIYTFTISAGESAPSIRFGYDDQTKSFFIASVDSGYQYSTTSSNDGEQLVFLKNGVVYNVLSDFTIGTHGTLSTNYIHSLDSITGFTPGVYTVQWYPTAQNLWSFVVSTGESTPQISFYYDTGLHFVCITQTVPGKYYSGSSSASGANLIFLKDDGSIWYISRDLSATTSTSATLSTAPIKEGDHITGFPVGTYTMIWKPTWGSGGLFNVFSSEFTFKMLTPHVGDICSGTVTVTWTDEHDFPDNPTSILYTLEYKTATGMYWNKIGDTFSTSYNWDTTSIPDGVYSVRVSSYANGIGFIADLDGNITISNYGNTPEQAQVYGVIFNDQGTPIANAVVGIMKTSDQNMTNGYWVETFTDQNGRYLINYILPGSYYIRASADGYESAMSTLTINGGEIQEIDLPLVSSTSSTYQYVGNSTRLIQAAQNGDVGGSLVIWKNSTTNVYQHEISIYNKDVTLSTIDVAKGSVSFVVSSENHEGKTIVINIDKNVIDPNGNIVVYYDGKPIKMAPNIDSVLDPTQGDSAEYVLIIGTAGMQALIKIPHFSTHTISISSIVEFFTGPIAAAVYLIFCVVIAVAATVHIRKMWRR